jgi:hypothetical protein
MPKNVVNGSHRMDFLAVLKNPNWVLVDGCEAIVGSDLWASPGYSVNDDE